ncbi:MAG TPA: hypothetical protein VN752_08215 [Solirubrobacterales bacterium]|nr:hypothetical protein [Solirubrobacterales bacterium]
MIVATIALFVALGGASYAALEVNSVGPKQLRKNAVRSPKVKDGSLTGIDMKDGSIALADLGANSVDGAKLVDGSVALADLAPNSVDGSKVVDGSLGGADVKAGTFLGGTITVQREDLALADNSTTGIEVACPAGATVIGGGSSVDQSSSDDIHLTVSRPFKTVPGAEGSLPVDGETFDAWRIVYRNPAGGTGAATARAFAICAQIP